MTASATRKAKAAPASRLLLPSVQPWANPKKQLVPGVYARSSRSTRSIQDSSAGYVDPEVPAVDPKGSDKPSSGNHTGGDGHFL